MLFFFSFDFEVRQFVRLKMKVNFSILQIEVGQNLTTSTNTATVDLYSLHLNRSLFQRVSWPMLPDS